MYSRQLSLHLLPGNWDTQFNKHRDQIVTALSVRERRKKGKRGAMYTHKPSDIPKGSQQQLVLAEVLIAFCTQHCSIFTSVPSSVPLLLL